MKSSNIQCMYQYLCRMWQGDGNICHVCSTQPSLGLVFKTEQKIWVSCHTHKECFTHPAKPPTSAVLCTNIFVSPYCRGAIYCLIAHGTIPTQRLQKTMCFTLCYTESLSSMCSLHVHPLSSFSAWQWEWLYNTREFFSSCNTDHNGNC